MDATLEGPAAVAPGEDVMTVRFILVLAGVALVAGAVANAGPESRNLGFHTTKISDVADTRQDYLDRAQADMQQWEARMRQWNADMRANGAQMSADASRDMEKAWATLKVDWKRLQVSGNDVWAKTRISFDRASQKMRAAWQSFNTSS